MIESMSLFSEDVKEDDSVSTLRIAEESFGGKHLIQDTAGAAAPEGMVYIAAG